MEITFEPEDTGELTGESPVIETNASGELTCEVCGTDLVYAGRGRKPKRCPEHKAKPVSNRTSGGRSTNIDTLISQINNLYLGMSTALTMIPPTAQDGMIIAMNAEKMAESWRPLIERDPKIRKFWERVCTSGGWGAVIMSHGLVALAIMQVHGVSMPFFGTTELRENVN